MIINRMVIDNIPITTYELNNNFEKPLLFFFHGFQNHRDNLMGRGEILAEKGFYVVAIDALYHGERLTPWFKELPREEKYKHIIDISIQTAKDALYLWKNYFKNNKKIRLNSFYAYGISMGSQITFTLATLTKDLKAAVTLVGSPSFIEYYKDRQKLFDWNDNFVEEKIKEYVKLDPLINYRKMKHTDFLLALGKYDDVVNPKYSIKLSKISKKNTTLKIYDTKHESTKEMLEDSYKYIEKYL